jgi:hypothetical protein
MKQETLEEAAENYAEIYRCPATNYNEYCKHDIISAINFGAKWQAERMYSEEDMINAHVMHQLSPYLKRNDFVKYAGGSDSKYLTIGEKYRLTCSPYRNRICVINDNGKRMNTLKRYFEWA